MPIRTLPTTVLQIFCKIILTFEVIVISIIDPDNNFWMNSHIVAILTNIRPEEIEKVHCIAVLSSFVLFFTCFG